MYEDAVAYKKYAIKRRDTKNIAAALKEARPMLEVEQRNLDSDEFMLNTSTLTYDLRNGIKFPMEHRPEHFITKQTTVDPSSDGADIWTAALDTFFLKDTDLIDYVQRMVGFSAIGKVYVEALIIAHGEGRNGKSIFWNVIARVLGTYSGNISADSMKNLNGIRFTGDRTLRYTADEIDAMFGTYEIGAYTFMLLSLLYPNLKYSQKGFHQDHMHPYTGFEESKIKGLVLPDGAVIDGDTKENWRRRRNTLANLQLLEGRENEDKNATPFVDWMKFNENREDAKYLPSDVSYELSNFEEFMEKRQELMSKALKVILL